MRVVQPILVDIHEADGTAVQVRREADALHLIQRESAAAAANESDLHFGHFRPRPVQEFIRSPECAHSVLMGN